MNIEYPETKNFLTAYEKTLMVEAKKSTDDITAKDVEEVKKMEKILRDDDLGLDDEEKKIDWQPAQKKKTFVLHGKKVEQWSYQRFYEFVKLYFFNKKPLLIWGDSGIGKSETVWDFAQQFAKAKGRTPVNFLQLSDEKQTEVIDNVEKYFLFVDVRAGDLEPSELAGVPKLRNDKPYLSTQIPRWLYVLSLSTATGILFLDELNHAPKNMLQSMFKVVDKTVGNTKMSDDISIMAASNLGDQFGGTTLPKALVARFKAGILVADPEGWLKWAESIGVDERILAFVRSNPAQHFNPETKFKSGEEQVQWANPRNLKQLSDAMKQLAQNRKELEDHGLPIESSNEDIIESYAVQFCGPEWGQAFITFLNHYALFKFRPAVKDAESGEFSKVEGKYKDPSVKYVVLMSVMEKLKQVLARCVQFVETNMTKKALTDQEWGEYFTEDVVKEFQKNLPDKYIEVFVGCLKILNALGDSFQANMFSHFKKDLSYKELDLWKMFAFRGDYDKQTKETFVKRTTPMMKEIFSQSK